MASRVLHLCADPQFWRFTDGTLERLAGAGYEVHAASFEAQLDARLARIRDVESHDLPLVRSIQAGRDAHALAATVALLRRVRPHLVHAHTPKGGLIGMMAARLTGGSARVYHTHGLRYESCAGSLRTLLMSTERISARLAHRVVCVSPSVRAAAIRDGIVAADKCRVLHHGSAQGISPDGGGAELRQRAHEWREAQGIVHAAPRAVFVGRWCRDKGLGRFPRLWRRVRQAVPHAQLLVVGEVDPTDPIDLTPLRDAPGIFLIGPLPDPRVALVGARALLLPSEREGLPQCVLEAASLRIPAVVSDVTGCVDSVLSERTGFVLPLADLAAWERRVVQLLQDAPLVERLGEAAERWVTERFDPEPQFQALLQLYTELGVPPERPS